ncbi:thioredoxin TrxC [Reinekea sp. G2M2-21]|uniref:thioredoxin TrxC n=1 Tax=Reinekea sp. G2M2-21 TaxID=2788942 RepID=UPI0018AA9ABF|nr:thioredoxin TrxC [Reinekea sp. G2M2-21]
MDMLKATCSHCGTANRVPAGKLWDKPICGKCKQPVISYKPVTVSEQNFDKFVLNTDLPVIVDFWASWCAPCVQFSPVFEQAATGWEPRVRFVKIDADATPALSQRLGIRSIPSLLLFYKGKEIERRAGAMPAQMFDQWLENQVSQLGV